MANLFNTHSKILTQGMAGSSGISLGRASR